MALNIKENSSTTNKIVQSIIKRIEDNDLQEGDKLESERELSRILKVSRSSIREAIRKLNGLGYVDTIEKIGTFISSKYLEYNNGNETADLLQLAPIMELMEVRYLLETSFINLASERATSSDINKLKDIVQKIESNINNEYDYYMLDLEFHLQIAKSTHNSLIIDLMDIIVNRIKSNEEYFISSGKSTIIDDIKIFKDIIASIETGNSSLATSLYIKHLSSVTDAIKRK